MDQTTLGKTGLRVSVMGLGCGGHSRLGMATGGTEADAIAIVHAALALGVTFFDTAEMYGTEDIVGRGLSETRRDQVVISTKAGVDWQGHRSTTAEMGARVDRCLQRLRTDYIDIFHLHGIAKDKYDYAVSELLPALVAAREAGKIRYIGITEVFREDPAHAMLIPAVREGAWDVVMVGFNILNQCARERVLTTTRELGIGTLCMFAVRRALSRLDALRELMADLVAQGKISPHAFDTDDPLGFLTEEGVADSLPEAAYRFCRHEPGLDVILSGTGNLDHLRANARSINLPPLPPAITSRLQRLFEGIDSVSGN